MTVSQQDFENRLRRVLHEQARALQVHPREWRGPAPPAARVSSRKLTIGNLVAAGGAAIAIAITAIALVVLGGHRATPTSGTGTRSARQQLIDSVSVLRRPQTNADRQPNMLGVYSIRYLPPQVRKHYGTPDWPLVRAVQLPTAGAKVVILPVRLPSAEGSEGLDIQLRTRTGGLGAGGPVSVATFLTHGINDTDYMRVGGGTLAVVVVPDGVARVALGPFRPSPGRTPLGSTINLSGLGATATVRENVATLQIGSVRAQAPRRRPSEPPVRAVAGVAAAARMTWFAPSGKIIGQSTIHLPIWVTIQRR